MSDLDRLSEAWRSARADVAAARAALTAAVRAAAAAGTSEYRLAKDTGLTRSTIRDMLGKPR